MLSALDMDFVSVFDIPVFCLDSKLLFCEVNATFAALFGELQGMPITEVSGHFNEKKCARKMAAGQVYRFKLFASDTQKTPYSVDLRRYHEIFVGFAVEAADAAKAEAMLASYSEMMEKQNKIMRAERDKSRTLLDKFLPLNIAEELKSLTGAVPKKFNDVGLLMMTFPQIGTLSQSYSEHSIFSEFDDLFTCFDLLAETYSCERLTATGDTYLTATNLSTTNDASCETLLNFSLDIVEVMKLRQSDIELPFKIGLHIGDVMAGVIGKTHLSFTAFGEGVSQVSDIAHKCEPLQIGCSPAFHQHISTLAPFRICIDTGTAEYFVLGPQFKNRDASHLHEVILRASVLRRSYY